MLDRRTALAFFACFLGVTSVLASEPLHAPLPPLTEPATNQQLAGKVVWADLFTSDVETERDFYQQLFGWEWRWVSESEDAYGVFYSGGEPVAGLAYQKPPGDEKPYGRWIHYISAADVAGIEKAVVDAGGRVVLSRRAIADRGEFAILAAPDSELLGVIHSSSGDPADFRAEPGQWLWFQLFTRDLRRSAEFYRTLFGYHIHERTDSPELHELVLAKGGFARAGMGTISAESASSPTWLGYVRVENVSETLERARALGGEVVFEPDAESVEGEVAVIADPSGATIGLLRWVDPEDAEEQP